MPAPTRDPINRREQVVACLYAEADLLRTLADALELRAEGSPTAFGPTQVHMGVDSMFRARMAAEVLGQIEDATAGVVVALDRFRAHHPEQAR